MTQRAWRQGPAVRIASVSLAAGAPRTWRTRLRLLPAMLRCVALVSIAIALAGPSCVVTTTGVPALDVVFLFDVSSSMRGMDLQPDRLRRAQQVVDEVVRARPDDRVALVLFSGEHRLVCPLTHDHGAFLSSLAQLASVDGEGTAVGAATSAVLEMVARVRADAAVVVVVTDGVSTRDDRDLADVAAHASSASIPIVVLQTGNGGPVPMPTEFGAVVIETDDPGPVLERFSRDSGGRLVDASRADAARELDAALAALEPLRPPQVRRRVDATGPWALVALAAVGGQLIAAGGLRMWL